MNLKKNIAKVLAVASLVTTLAPSVTMAAAPTPGVPTSPSGVSQPVADVTNEYTNFAAIFDNADTPLTVGDSKVDLKDEAVEFSFDAKVKGDQKPAIHNRYTLDFKGATSFSADTQTFEFKDLDVKVASDAGDLVEKANIVVSFKNVPVDKNTTGTVMLIPTDSTKKHEVEKMAVKFDVTVKDAAPKVEPVSAAEKQQAEALISGTTVEVANGKVYVSTPATPNNLTVKYTVKDDKGAVIKTFDGGAMATKTPVQDASNKVNLKVVLDIARKSDSLVFNTHTIAFNTDLSDSKPVVNYAYVIDGGLVINATSKAGMAGTPIFWKYSYEKDWRAITSDFGYGYKYNKEPEVRNFDDLFGKVAFDKYRRLDNNDYRIPVEIPSKIQLVLVDSIGNKTPVQLNIDKNNYILKGTGIGDAPAYVDKLIKNVTEGDVVGNVKRDGLLVIKKDTTVNLYESFKGKFQDTWDSYNTRELTWTSEQLSSFDPYNIKFDREGRYEFKIKKDNSTKEIIVTVLVNDGKNNIKDFEIIKDVHVNGNSFRAMDAVKFTTINSEKPNPINFYAKADGKFYRMNDDIPFGNKDKVEIVITDLVNNRDHKVTVTKGSLAKKTIAEARNMFTDIRGHWAENKIVSLVANGVISGYPDRTFKPENKITIRETLAIVGRYAQSQDASKINKEVVSEVNYDKANWGSKEVEFALKRLPQNIFSNVNLDTAISREQTAYVMAHVFNYPASQLTNGLTDLNTSIYQSEVAQLVAAGTITGYPDKTFKPQLPITRAELCSMMFTIPGIRLDVVDNSAPTVAPVSSDNKVKSSLTVNELDALFK